MRKQGYSKSELRRDRELDDKLTQRLHDFIQESGERHRRRTEQVGPCPCECNSGGFCGGCGHAGCGGRRTA